MSDIGTGQAFDDIGARLRGARERSGMNVAQAAEKLHCDRQLVEALEAGRFKDIGAPVFARGHLRRYAELVGEPIGELLERFDAAAAGRVMLPDLTRIPRARRAPDTRRMLWPIVIAVAVVVFGVLISWVLRDSPLPTLAGITDAVTGSSATPAASTADIAAQAGTTSDVAVSAPVEGPLAVDGTGQADAGAVTSSDGTAVGAASSAAPVAAPVTAPMATNTPATTAPTATTVATPPTRTPAAAPLRPGEVEFRVRATADCWVEIYDADRDRLYFDLVRSGGQARVRGTPPFRVLLGNASGATLDVSGRRVAVPRSAIRGNAAFLSLAGDGTAAAIKRD